ncbi:hypothetical protein JCM11641_006513 [Rhodosporidiobolus odoratus]
MLSRLPLELVQYIVQLSLPSTISPHEYRQRQDVLLALSQACKALRMIAEPLLYDVVQAKADKTADLLLEALQRKEAWGQRIKALFLAECGVKGWDHTLESFVGWPPQQLYASFAALMPHLVDLRLCLQGVDLADLQTLQRLRRLVVSNSILLAFAPTSLSFPDLEKRSIPCSDAPVSPDPVRSSVSQSSASATT